MGNRHTGNNSSITVTERSGARDRSMLEKDFGIMFLLRRGRRGRLRTMLMVFLCFLTTRARDGWGLSCKRASKQASLE
jgi:hypothetical protein